MVDNNRVRLREVSQFSLSFLLQLLLIIALLLASFKVLPDFAKFRSFFPSTVLAVALIGALFPSLFISLLRQPVSGRRLWHSIGLSLLAAGWGGLWAGYACNLHFSPGPQWPGIGGGFYVWISAFLIAFFVAIVVPCLVPREPNSLRQVR